MTIMDNSNPRNFWAYIGGEREGIKHPVKNLGWIIKHRADIESVSVERFFSLSFDRRAHFQARLISDGTRAMEDSRRMYYATFEDFTVAVAFMNHKRFAHVKNKKVKG
jgi:hypothetical protein